jgi:NADPH:quinone reductase-like Zn-dependent oxidoreductase
MEAKVIAVSKDNWIKTDFGADYIINDYDKVVEQVKGITQGKMVDVVLNSLGINTWESSFASTGINGRWIAFGGLTGADVKLNVQALYTNQIKLLGSTGGTRKELQELIDIASKEGLKVKVWKKFKLADVKEALKALFAKDRSGRILLEVSSVQIYPRFKFQFNGLSANFCFYYLSSIILQSNNFCSTSGWANQYFIITCNR